MRGRFHPMTTALSVLAMGVALVGCVNGNHAASEAGSRALSPDASVASLEPHTHMSPKGVPSARTPLHNYLLNNPRPSLPSADSAVTPAAHEPATSHETLPGTTREPSWDLDTADPARDYVTRYLRATKRYGAQMGCVVITPSRFIGDRSVVEIHNDASGACGKADELRDRFVVQVAADRMKLDDSLHQPKLHAWPDGSDPDGPPSKVADVPRIDTWKAPLRSELAKLELAPIRIQLYGRGTYPVVLLAGWHGVVQQGMTPAQLEAPAKALCAANDGDPMGVFAGMDRSTFLRISCPGSARFDAL